MDRNILRHLISLWCITMLLWRTDASSNVTTNNDNSNNSQSTNSSVSMSRNTTPITSENNILDSSVHRSDGTFDVTTESSAMKLFNSNNSTPSNRSKTPNNISSICRLTAVDSTLHETIRTLIVDEQVKLLEYHLVFTNYSVNPLQAISRYAYKLESWARASSRHGQTLLSLAFNYGILSLRTLSFGTDALVVEMEDTPSGCVVGMNEEQVVDQLLYLLSRDFKDTGEMMLEGEERICHEVIVDVHGYAKFKDQCFKSSGGASDELVETDAGNFWINLLYTMLMLVRFGVIFFGPLLLTSAVGKLSRKSIPYVVKLKEPLKKKVVIATLDTELPKIKAERTIALRADKGFPKLANSLRELNPTLGKPFDVQIPQYDILVSYKRLLTENRVPVGLWRSIGRAIFYCKIRNVGPFQACCTVNMFASCPCVDRVTPWSHFWRKVGLALMAVCIPFPWYVRLWIFYSYEYAEVLLRKEATYKVGLKENLDNSLIHFFTPSHWIFTVIYILYFATVIILVYMTRRSEEGRFRKILVGSFSDLENLSWFRVLHMLVSNVIWPFQRFGVCGLFVAFVYWPIVIPITLVAFALYSLPLTYLTIRMFFYSRRMVTVTEKKRSGVRTYRDKRQVDETIERFEASSYFGNGLSKKDETLDFEQTEEDPSFEGEVDLDKIKRKSQPDSASLASTIVLPGPCRPRRFIENMLASTLCVLSLFSILLILSECLGCLVEIIVFTMMGIIVNASTLLKYVSLVILIVVYSCDSFNNVEKKYLKLNKALFNEVKGRIKDLDKITSLPSNLQENRGFKSQEMSEQGAYESPDEVTQKPARHWFINDLVLFVDNEDMPRIPKKLFDEVCQIKVAGVPGPVYRGLLFGIKQFLKIFLFIFFVFIVVLSFGEVYKISSTNQMLATLAGGFLPAILRQFMEPERPDIEIGTVSFKSKLDEIIKNFYQVWPMYDLPLERVPDPEEQPNPDGQEHPEEHPNNNMDKEKKNEIFTNNVSILKEDFLNRNVDSNAETSSGDAVLKKDKHVGFDTEPESESVDLLILLPVPVPDKPTSNQNLYDQWSGIGGFEQNAGNVSDMKQDIETGSPMLGVK